MPALQETQDVTEFGQQAMLLLTGFTVAFKPMREKYIAIDYDERIVYVAPDMAPTDFLSRIIQAAIQIKSPTLATPRRGRR